MNTIVKTEKECTYKNHRMERTASKKHDESNTDMLLVKKFNNVEVTVYGCSEDPLFITDDIVTLLGINYSNLSDDNNGKILINTYELYELLSLSNEKVVIEFKKWIYETLKETRLQERSLTVDINKKSKTDEINMVHHYLNNNYDEIEKKGCVYIISTDKSGIYKCGRTKVLRIEELRNFKLVVLIQLIFCLNIKQGMKYY
jgi:prophage antirepressor-like protein